MKSLFARTGSKAAPESGRAPWYVDVFLAFGGWIAGLLAGIAIFAFGFALFAGGGVEVAWAGLLIGLAFIAAGLAIGGRSAFRRHFAVAIVGAGLTAFSGGLVWIFIKIFGESSRAVGASLVATSAAQAILAAFAARRLDDRILSFLATLGWFGLAGAGFALVFGGDAKQGAAPFAIFAALCGVAGANLFIGAGLARRPAVGAALLCGPMFAGEILRSAFGAGDVAPDMMSFLPSIIYAAATLFCLSRLARRTSFFGLAAAGCVLLAFIWFLPDSGAAAVLALVAGMAAQSRALAAIGVVALAAFVSRFYNDLSLPLLQKSALFCALGAATVALAEGLRRFGGAPVTARALRGGRRSVAVVLGFGALLAGSAVLVNREVLALERDFRQARLVWFALAPVDPRSILQGDYMALNFDDALFPPAETKLDRRGEIFLALDARGVARFSRLERPGDNPLADEIRVDYQAEGGRPRYCPESFFFQEGEADLFAAARFAVVKIAPDGKTRLVALADKDLKTIRPLPSTPQ